MALIHHMNVTDHNQQIYCCLRNKVVVWSEQHKRQFCGSCKMYVEDIAMLGVTCKWEDQRDVSEPYLAENAYTEWESNQSRMMFQRTHSSQQVQTRHWDQLQQMPGNFDRDNEARGLAL